MGRFAEDSGQHVGHIFKGHDVQNGHLISKNFPLLLHDIPQVEDLKYNFYIMVRRM